MSDRIEPCAYGCKVAHKHRTDCHNDACPGCLPRIADVGQLCQWCYNRLTADLTEVPELLAHLNQVGQPCAPAIVYDKEIHAHGNPAEGDPYPQAWHARDEIQNAVSGWARHVSQERFKREPDVDRDGPAGWLRGHLPWAVQHTWIADMRAELGTLISTSKARWPMVDRSRHIGMPCPRCDMLTLTYSPPTEDRHPATITCDNPDCARRFTEDEFDWFKHLAITGQAS